MKYKILNNITKQFFVSRKFLKENSITEQECYNIVFTEGKCKFCSKTARFTNWKFGYHEICNENICNKKLRSERTTNTNLLKYGVANVSQNKEIKQRKHTTFKNNFGVDNISQLIKTQESIRKTNESNNRWIKLLDRDPYLIYCKAASFKHGFSFNKYTTIKEKELLAEYGIYNNRINKRGCVRDHLLSRKFGFENNIPVWIISHPANCEIVLHTENMNRARGNDNIISFKELLEKIYS